jgi:lipopolysaccharide/colanic/teichoic acid biosynthesis glycosyltransferase
MSEPDSEARSPAREIVEGCLLRVGDLLIAAALVVLTFPLMVFVCLAIKLETSGPAFYRQPRLARNGPHFHALRFRTTAHDPERASRPIWDRGARETRVGTFLEYTGIEDLPQLVNVLRGEMALLGKVRRLRRAEKWAVWATAAAASGGALFQGAGSVLGLLE